VDRRDQRDLGEAGRVGREEGHQAQEPGPDQEHRAEPARGRDAAGDGGEGAGAEAEEDERDRQEPAERGVEVEADDDLDGVEAGGRVEDDHSGEPDAERGETGRRQSLEGGRSVGTVAKGRMDDHAVKPRENGLRIQ
jgi:hypothetical protein